MTTQNLSSPLYASYKKGKEELMDILRGFKTELKEEIKDEISASEGRMKKGSKKVWTACVLVRQPVFFCFKHKVA